MTEALSLEASIEHCRAITRRAATSFYYAFKTLPRRKRLGFEVVYAFMRLSDDLSDDETGIDRAAAIRSWRGVLEQALAGDVSAHPVMPALVHVLEEFEIPSTYLFELIDGTEQDLEVTRFQSFEEVYGYCYHVASTVGLVSLRLFGLKDPSPARWEKAEALAIACGQGFQLTNILRDVKEDIERDRVYLPLDDLSRFGVTVDDLRNHSYDAKFRELMSFEAERAEAYYVESAPLLEMIPRDAQPCLRAMRGIYHGILTRIIACEYDVWSRRVRVPLPSKLGIAAKAFFGIGS